MFVWAGISHRFLSSESRFWRPNWMSLSQFRRWYIGVALSEVLFGLMLVVRIVPSPVIFGWCTALIAGLTYYGARNIDLSGSCGCGVGDVTTKRSLLVRNGALWVLVGLALVWATDSSASEESVVVGAFAPLFLATVVLLKRLILHLLQFVPALLPRKARSTQIEVVHRGARS